MVTKLNESLFDDLSDPVFKDRYNDGLDWYRITYEYSPEYGNSYDRETWVRAKNIKDAEQKFFEKHNDDCYISEIMDKETALGIDYEMESIDNDPILTTRNQELKANKITIDTLTYDILDVLEEHGYDADADDVIKFAEHEADILWNTRGTLNAEAWYENMFDEDPEQLKRLTKKMNELLDPNKDDTLKNYAIELETGEIKVIKAKSMDDAANKVMNEYDIPLWAFGVCGIVDDDFAASCGKFESVNIEDKLEGCHYDGKEENMVIKEVYDDSLYVDIDELIGTLGRALEEGTRDPDVFAELADVYGRLVEMRDVGYQLSINQSE